MSHSIPYYLLASCSVTALAALLLRKQTFTPLLLMFTFSGMIYFFEFFVMVWFNAYAYLPGILAKPYYDNALGAIFSNFLSVPVAATIISSLQLRTRYIVISALAFGSIEWLFIRLGVYEHRWWTIGFTILSLLFFFSLTRWWALMLSNRRRWCIFLSLVMLSWSLVGTLVFTLAIAGVRTFHSGHFEDPYHDDIFTSTMYGFAKACILASAAYRFTTIGPRVASLLLIFLINVILIKLDILRLWIPLWQYWCLYVPCCVLVSWLVSLSLRSLRGMSLSIPIKRR